MLRFGFLLLLFDVYMTWARIEKATTSPPLPLLSASTADPTNGNISVCQNSTVTEPFPYENGTPTPLASQPVLVQYLFFLILCSLETISFHLPIRLLLSGPLPRPFRKVIPYYPHPSMVSIAILVSSFTKLFPLLMLVWPYDLPSSASAVSWAVIINNVAAMEILLDCGYIRAGILCAVGAVCRAGVGWVILRAVGIGGDVAAVGVVETVDLIEIWRRIMEGVGLG
ncbi:hypothetical protein K470DRAFT_254095 [Piedraia hortae CBS 480.64]|uniref:Protein ARV n=1 Tax=Piedraia hortae CBS 480.64 TaxID=1314780 RepID=A0A6A7CB59_9PEZI|nr:hypothetical protein K470DRAFT_254095 [Piedraia hortae CBS 480.64]